MADTETGGAREQRSTWAVDLGLSLAFWLVLSLPDLARVLLGGEFRGPEGYFFFEVLLEKWIWIPLTPAVFAAARRLPFRRGIFGRRLLLHGGIGALLIAAHSTLLVAAQYALGYGHLRQSSVDHWVEHLSYPVAASALLYGPLLGVAIGTDYYRRYRATERRAARLQLERSHLETRLVQARLDLLTRQLRPHFLFNSLNAVAAILAENPSRARRMIARISELLRHTLDLGDGPRVPLRRELEILRLYLEIEHVRFEDRLRTRIDVDPGCKDLAIPPLLLQPLAENAVRHGIAADGEATEVSITATRVDERLRVIVRNDGPGIDGEISDGVGLGNTRERLRELFADGHRLDLEDDPGGGVRATLEIPAERCVS